MASLGSTDSRDLASTPGARDALAFVRIGGPEAISFFRAADQEGAAEALLRFSAVLASEQDDEDLKRRGLECTKALPAQGIPGYGASVQAVTWLLRLFTACALGAAGWAILDFLVGDPSRDPYLLPPEVIFLPFEEILLLAPIALIVVYALAHLAVLWREQTTTRAVLRWAAGDQESRRLGIPAQSPFARIMTRWEGLKVCAGGVLMMDGFLTVFLYFARRPDETYGLFLAPVVCALPILTTYLISGARIRLAQRRHVLVADRLFRVPSDEVVSLPSSMVVEGLRSPAANDADSIWTQDDEDLEEPLDEDTEWRTSFSADAAPADHLVDPERRER